MEITIKPDTKGKETRRLLAIKLLEKGVKAILLQLRFFNFDLFDPTYRLLKSWFNLAIIRQKTAHFSICDCSAKARNIETLSKW